MKKAILQIFTAILVLGLFCGAATAAPSISGEITPPQNTTTPVTGTVSETKAFTIPLNETANVVWAENGVDIKTTPTDGNNIATLNYPFKLGSYQLTARIEGVGQVAAWNVEGKAEGPVVVTLSNPSDLRVTNNVGESRTFTATI
ncbi:MAG TPA: hypothetical protein VFM18_11465, partial [Methanosarcina sp.]|nr:hypothetical protein [Methanosarcina sp.]